MTHPDPAVQRAELLVQAGRDAEALRTLAPHLAAHPDDPLALHVAGQAQLGAGDLDGALFSASRLAVAAPDDLDTQLLLAQVHAKRREVVPAQLAVDRAIRLAPNSFVPYQVGAVVDLWSGLVTARTEDLARRAVLLAPQNPDTHRTLGTVLLERRKRDDAAVHLGQAAALDPADPITANELGRLALHRKDTGSAMRNFAAAARADPSAPGPARNINITAWNALTVAQIVLWATLFLVGRIRWLATGDDSTTGWLHAGALVALVLTLGTWVFLLRRAWSGLDVLARAITSDRLLTVAMGCHAIALGCLVAGIVSGGPVSTGVLLAGAILVAVTTVLMWVHDRRERRRRRAG